MCLILSVKKIFYESALNLPGMGYILRSPDSLKTEEQNQESLEEFLKMSKTCLNRYYKLCDRIIGIEEKETIKKEIDLTINMLKGNYVALYGLYVPEDMGCISLIHNNNDYFMGCFLDEVGEETEHNKILKYSVKKTLKDYGFLK